MSKTKKCPCCEAVFKNYKWRVYTGRQRFEELIDKVACCPACWMPTLDWPSTDTATGNAQKEVKDEH